MRPAFDSPDPQKILAAQQRLRTAVSNVSSQINHTIDQINARCAEFRPNDPRGQACQDIAGKLQAWRDGTEPAASVQYSLDKKPKDVWNMVAGVQFALNRNWYFRTEVGFLGSRTSVLVGTEYKFDL